MKYFCNKCKSYTERDDHKSCRQCGADLKDAAFAPSTTLAGFKIINEIGRGANGVVYLAEQTSLDRQVALKILPDAKAEDPDFVKAFLKEARAAARLNHPAIIQVYDAGVTDNGIYFLAMELIDGKSLENILQAKGALKVDKVLKIALELAEALDYSWNKEHMFHGDIKPDNIMIRKDGQTKLADFGLAKTIFDEKMDDIMATPMYAPPEVIRAEHDKIGCKSDMYSFGVTLYELIYGTAPFNEEDCQKVLELHLNEQHVPLSEKVAGVDKSLSTLVDHLLQKDPEKRPSSWSRIIESLQLLQNKSKTAKSQLHIGTFIAVILVLAAVIGGAFLFYWEINKEIDNTRKNNLQIKPVIKKITEKVVEKAPAVKPPPETKPEVKSEKNEKAEDVVVTPKPPKIDKNLVELKQFMNAVDNIDKVSILAASHLRFRAMEILQRESFPETEKFKVKLCLTKINKVIAQKQQVAATREIDSLRLRLKKEKRERTDMESYRRRVNLTLLEQNRIFKMITAFGATPEPRRTAQVLSTLIKKNQGINKNSPEFKVLAFLQGKLPRKYNREAIIFENLDQLEGEKLPWKIRDMEYVITGGSWQSMHLRTRLSKDVYSRKKIQGSKLNKKYWLKLIDTFLLKGKMEVSAKHINNTACWLMVNADAEFFKKFVSKYCRKDYSLWLECRNTLDIAPREVSAFSAWKQFTGQINNLNPAAYRTMQAFVDKYSNSEVYKHTRKLLAEYSKITDTIYPEGVAQRLRLKQLGENSPNGRIFSAFIRYGYVIGVPLSVRSSMRTLYKNRLNSLSGQQEFDGQFGIFSEVPCGKVFGWMTADRQKQGFLTLKSLPALIDVDNWNLTRRIFRKIPKGNLEVSKIGGEARYYPYFLYNTGIIALRYCRWKVMDEVFTNFKKLIDKTEESTEGADTLSVRALLADLALRNRGNSYAWDVLNEYKFGSGEDINAGEIIITLLKIETLLTQYPVNELKVSKLINDAVLRYDKTEKLQYDLAVLKKLHRLICASSNVRNGNTRTLDIKPDLFKGLMYPNLHARLWLEAAARDKLLHRDSLDLKALLQASRSVLTSSSFRSELFKRITLLEIASEPFTPESLRVSLNESVSELKPCATQLYPALLTLLFATEVLDYSLPVHKLGWFARNFSARCPVFSPLDRRIYSLLSESNLLKILENVEGFYPTPSREIYLWILAAARAKRSGNFDACLVKLQTLKNKLSWGEQLLLTRSVQLLKNYE